CAAEPPSTSSAARHRNQCVRPAQIAVKKGFWKAMKEDCSVELDDFAKHDARASELRRTTPASCGCRACPRLPPRSRGASSAHCEGESGEIDAYEIEVV